MNFLWKCFFCNPPGQCSTVVPLNGRDIQTKGKTATDVWTQYVQCEYVLAGHELSSAICRMNTCQHAPQGREWGDLSSCHS